MRPHSSRRVCSTQRADLSLIVEDRSPIAVSERECQRVHSTRRVLRNGYTDYQNFSVVAANTDLCSANATLNSRIAVKTGAQNSRLRGPPGPHGRNDAHSVRGLGEIDRDDGERRLCRKIRTVGSLGDRHITRADGRERENAIL